jgi:hypothetical protein
MFSTYYIQVLNVINSLSLIGGIITVISGATLMPQTITNSGDKYIGNAESYNRDLQKAQLASYGFKVVIVGLSITAINFILLLIICCCPYLQEYFQEHLSIHPQPIQAYALHTRVTIGANATDIAKATKATVIGVDKTKNLKKWTEDTVTPEDII